MRVEQVASSRAVVPYAVHATGRARDRVAVTDRGQGLWLLDSADLGVLHRWQLDADAIGTHAVSPVGPVALVSGRHDVSLLDAGGRRLWRHEHTPWDPTGGYQSGCAWFDEQARPYALVPAEDYDGCEIRRLDATDGSPVGSASIPAAPAGLEAIHQGDGWVGLSVGEGQDAAQAWWVRARPDRLETLHAPWYDEILFDVDRLGRRVLTTPHVDGPLKVRSFPSLDVEREVDPPPGWIWDFFACFAGDHLVARARSEQTDDEFLAVVDAAGVVREVARTEAPISPGPEGSWFAWEPDRLTRRRLAG